RVTLELLERSMTGAEPWRLRPSLQPVADLGDHIWLSDVTSCHERQDGNSACLPQTRHRSCRSRAAKCRASGSRSLCPVDCWSREAAAARACLQAVARRLCIQACHIFPRLWLAPTFPG